MLGTGDDAFQPQKEYGPREPLAIAVADFNGDGKLDLVVANASSNAVSVLLGKGTARSIP